MAPADVLVLHGIGPGFEGTDAAEVAYRLGVPVQRVELYDYAAYLDGVRWPRALPSLFGFLPVLPGPIRIDGWADRKGDVAAYFAAPGKREELAGKLSLDIYARAHRLGDRPLTIVAHSLGSVVAWDRNAYGLTPPRLILLGSPLAMRPVRWFIRHDRPRPLAGAVDVVAGRFDPVACCARDWDHGGTLRGTLGGHDLTAYLQAVRSLGLIKT